MAGVVITEFTDPGCPWAWSAEPHRRRLDWIYGDEVEWRTRMVVLAESPADQEEKGFTTKKEAESFARISAEHGMPIATGERPRLAATAPACRAVVATRLNSPAHERQVLRCLRVANFCGELLDDDAVIARAVETAGLDPDDVAEWTRSDETEEAMREDMARSREPLPAARALDHKLANWSGGRRYTCPSYEICRAEDGVTISVPGFQPFAAYDVVLANLIPEFDRREPAEDAAEVLRWAGTPLATKEVAAVMDVELRDARERLGRVATERHVGADGFWTLAG